MPSLTVGQLAEACGGEIEGNSDHIISGANTLQNATENDLSFVANDKLIETAAASRAGCLLVNFAFDRPGPWSLIRAPDPRSAFARAVNILYPKKRPDPAIHATASIARSAKIATDVYIGPFVVIGENTSIRNGCFIGSGCSIGDRVSVGENTTLHANTVIYDDVRIGARVILHSGCIIGADGFGFTLINDHYEKFPQIGSVEIGDDVEIGANCCVDRATLDATRIGSGTKLDNLVHVAHNCEIGKHVVVAAQTGFSGSVVVGDYAVIGGQVGIGEKAKIAPHVIIGGKAGILTGQTIAAGEPVWGIPARPLRQHLKGLAHIAKLPQIRAELNELKRKIGNREPRS